MVAVSFDATRYLDRKLSALAAHQSALARGEIKRWPLGGFFDELDVFETNDVGRVTARV